MDSHVRVVAILNILLGAFWLLLGLFIMLIFGSIPALLEAVNEGDLPVPIDMIVPVIRLIGGVILVFFALTSFPAIIAGIGLLQFREWGRILGIVISAINLLHVPVGTILGVYGLWVLLKNETVQLFRTQEARNVL